MTTAILWFRRDLRLADHPALLEAADGADGVVALFVLDPRLERPGTPRTERLYASLAALDASIGGSLVIRRGDPRVVVPETARLAGARSVHVSRETTPYGRRRDEQVGAILAASGVELVATGTPYAAGPGLVLTAAGTPYRVFTPFSRAWRDRGWPPPAPRPDGVNWRGLDESGRSEADGGRPAGPAAYRSRVVGGVVGEVVGEVAAGEAAALGRWRSWLDAHLGDYATRRDRPDLDVTSRMSAHLKFGEIHPRTMLHDIAAHPLGHGDSAQRFVTELAWREFYADVLWHEPRSAWHDLRPHLANLDYDDGPESEALVEAWRRGRTGYPIIDAGMRQLTEEGWMPGRVRMITASFLTKDLHVWWPVGARHFLDHLMDGDLASNNHGWQWVAGTGTDAAPYFRIFNPTTQGKKVDPGGRYVRRWVPELARLDGGAVHEPWRHEAGYSLGYPTRIVDHDDERREALARYARARG